MATLGPFVSPVGGKIPKTFIPEVDTADVTGLDVKLTEHDTSLTTLRTDVDSIIANGAGAKPFVNVKDEGAAGDGVTDDTATLQAALDAAGSGTVVVFPAGNYLVTGTLYLRNKTRTTLLGMGGLITINRSSMNNQAGTLLHVENCANSTVEGLSFSDAAVAADANTPNRSAVALVTCNNTWVKGCTVVRSSGPGVTVSGSSSAYVDACRVQQTTGDGVKVGAGNTGVVVRGCDVANATSNGLVAYVGASETVTKGVLFDRNRVTSVTGNGVHVHAGDVTRLHAVSTTGNVVQGATGSGILVDSVTDEWTNDNAIDSVGEHGVYISNCVGSASVETNTVRNAGDSGAGSWAGMFVEAGGADLVKVFSNDVKDRRPTKLTTVDIHVTNTTNAQIVGNDTDRPPLVDGSTTIKPVHLGQIFGVGEGTIKIDATKITLTDANGDEYTIG